MGVRLAKMTLAKDIHTARGQLTGTAKKSLVGPVAVQAGEPAEVATIVYTMGLTTGTTDLLIRILDEGH